MTDRGIVGVLKLDTAQRNQLTTIERRYEMALDRLMAARLEGHEPDRVLYVSPLKALNYDVQRNLSGPLAGLADGARRAGMTLPEITVAVRTGDTPQAERQRMLRRPPDVLITTPESLYLMLTSQASKVLAGVRTIIVDEIHAVAATKRGAHMALSLERLQRLVAADGGSLQRIGLSATQRPLSEVARFLGGQDADGAPRPVQVVDAGISKQLDLEVIVPVEDMSDLAGGGPTPMAEDLSEARGQECALHGTALIIRRPCRVPLSPCSLAATDNCQRPSMVSLVLKR